MSFINLLIKSIKARLVELENKQWNDFIHFNQSAPWTQAAVNTGSVSSLVTPAQKHPGVASYVSAAVANSGYGIRILITALLLAGGEKTTFIFKTATTITGVTRRMGFHDTTDYNDAVDGVYAEIVDGVIKGKTANNSVRSTTGTTYTLTAATWYRLVVQLNADASLATYTLYADDSATVLWKDTLTTNIPKTVGRETGHGDVCTYLPAVSDTIGHLDYIDLVLPNARRVV